MIVQHDLGGLTPELEPWSWSVAYSHRDSEAAYPQRPGETLPLIGMGENGPFQDRFSPDRVLLNLKAEHKLNAKLTAFVDWKNLLREYETYIVDGPTHRASYASHDPWAVLAGMRYKM